MRNGRRRLDLVNPRTLETKFPNVYAVGMAPTPALQRLACSPKVRREVAGDLIAKLRNSGRATPVVRPS